MEAARAGDCSGSSPGRLGGSDALACHDNPRYLANSFCRESPHILLPALVQMSGPVQVPEPVLVETRLAIRAGTT